MPNEKIKEFYVMLKYNVYFLVHRNIRTQIYNGTCPVQLKVDIFQKISENFFIFIYTCWSVYKGCDTGNFWTWLHCHNFPITSVKVGTQHA